MKIKDAPLIEEPKGTDKMPASDGSNQPKALSLNQILGFVRQQGGGGGSGIMPPMTFNEYDAIEEKQSTLYFIVDDNGELTKIFYGTFLVARKGANGEVAFGFPLVFPFVFG